MKSHNLSNQQLKGAACVLSAVLSLLLYLSSIPADFAFDDNFAVVYNGDVTSSSNSVWGLLQHDFWGQRVSSSQSHKSYRPLTALVFRLTRQAWQALPVGLTQPVHEWRQAQHTAPADEKGRRPASLDPLPFHVVNVLLHAAVGWLFCRLAYQLFHLHAALALAVPLGWRPAEQSSADSTAAQTPASNQHDSSLLQSSRAPRGTAAGSIQQSAQTSADGIRKRKSQPLKQQQAVSTKANAVLQEDQLSGSSDIAQPRTTWHGDAWNDSSADLQALLQVHLPAFTAALAFAAHPVHTEAVAGIVGQAELLSALFSLCALLVYVPAAQRSSGLSLARHWLRVLAAVLLCWLAALSKEIGITVVGSMAVFEILLVPLVSKQPDESEQSKLAGSKQGPGALQHLLSDSRKWGRLLVLFVAGLLYVKMRSWVAVDQLVRIYRKVENPIPFSPDHTTRLLTTAHLHVRYLWLLLWPQHLSADWSFECIPLVHSWRDARNLGAVGVYGALLVCMCLARPWRIPVEWLARDRPQGTISAAILRHRWRLAILVGLMVGPFFPASNVLFYVGTFIGERLLYAPSMGFCVLLGEAVAAVCQVLVAPLLQPSQHAARQRDTRGGTDNPQTGSQQPQRLQLWRRLGLCVLLACLVMVLAGYSYRTVRRNIDWWSEERLFLSALEVCPNSAKVQLNSGILRRRYLQHDQALQHFRAAQQIDPTYCEPTYWIGLTLVNQGHVQEGVQQLEFALSCKYVAAEVLKALNTLYSALQQAKPGDGFPLLRWAATLLRPEVGRLAEGCDFAEQAAVAYGSSTSSTGSSASSSRQHQLQNVAMSLGLCVSALDAHIKEGGTAAPSDAAPLRSLLLAQDARELRQCVQWREPLHLALALHAAQSPQARQAAYAYLRAIQAAPSCRQLLIPASDAAATSSGHIQLIHKVQSSDAEDPWLQQEWGRILALQGRSQEAALHLYVAGVIFQKQYQQLQHHGKATVRQLKDFSKFLSATDALNACAESFEQAASLQPANVCELLLQALDARVALMTDLANQKQAAKARQSIQVTANRVLQTAACAQFHGAARQLLDKAADL